MWMSPTEPGGIASGAVSRRGRMKWSGAGRAEQRREEKGRHLDTWSPVVTLACSGVPDREMRIGNWTRNGNGNGREIRGDQRKDNYGDGVLFGSA